MPPGYRPTTSQTNGHHATHDLMRTKFLLLGMRRSGKTSIQEVLFNNLPAKQTFYLERTSRTTKYPYDTIIPLEIWDCPGDMNTDQLEVPLSQFATIIFVIDIQDLYQPSITKLVNMVVAAYNEGPRTNIEVFVHKADTLSEEYRMENWRYIQQRILDELGDISPEYEQMIPINFHLTSIHDHTLHDAFSRTLHKSIESLPYLEDLLNVFCTNSQSSKAFLFDINSRLYVATDASPVDAPTHSLCNDYLLMLNSFGPLYKSITASPARHTPPTLLPTVTPIASLPSSPRLNLGTSSMPSSVPRSSLLSSRTPPTAPASPTKPDADQPPPINGKVKALFYPSASATLAPSAVGVLTGTTLTYYVVTKRLALLALLPTAVWEQRRGLVEYNVVFFREGVQEICDVEDDVRGGR
ncbi:Gtr1/RagA G protein conserved region-domain-containing protein [Fomitopsis betulina]|nr:Gtr1/RagA G protein conserved region-domain-containing protein [Fomitopsis betulina]